jgi:hypothetical protein
MRIRKQDYELNLLDLRQFPVWEYALDEEQDKGQDERTVRPYLASSSVDPHKAYLIVRASFHLIDNTQMVGYIRPVRLSGPKFMAPVVPVDMNPVIVTEKGQVVFWYGASKPDSEEISQNYHLLKKKPSNVFPIRFVSDVEVMDSIAEGTLEGFLYCNENVQDFFDLKLTDIQIIR